MRATRRVMLVGTVLGFAVGSPVAGASRTVRPHQHFIGQVNGSRSDAVVYTVCGGPGSPDGLGPVAGGQTMAVIKRREGAGDTGPFNQIYAWFVPTKSDTEPPVQLTFTHYRENQTIPTDARVPCDGTGQVEFSSCPYLAPCAAGFVPAFVNVTFVNVAD